jgi:HK97 family phage prohead protease
MADFERRFATVEFDAGTDETAPRFYGTPIRYNSRTAIGDPKTYGFYEEVAPGAVDLEDRDLAMLVDHDSSKIVSRMSAGTLSAIDTADGFKVESKLDDDLSYVRDLKTNLRNGNIKGMSFGFHVPEGGDEIRKQDDGTILRVVNKMNLVEVSAVTFPAYTSTEASMRGESPLLVERRAAWEAERSSVNSEPEAEVQKAYSRRERNLRYLAARYGLPYERTNNG